MTKTLDLTHGRGDTFIGIIRLENGIQTSSFNEVWFTVRTGYAATGIADETGALTSGTLTGGEISETGTSEWTVTIVDPNWTVGRLVYDVQVRTPADQVFTIIKGILRVYDDVTRST